MTRERITVILVLFPAVIVVGLFIEAVKKTREAAARTQTANNLKQVGLALHNFNDTYRTLPPAFDGFSRHERYFRGDSVHVYLLPYTEFGYDKHMRQLLEDGKENEILILTFLAPSDSSSQDPKGVQNFAANLRVFSDKGYLTLWNRDLPRLARLEPGHAQLPDSFKDGTSSTIVYSTKLATCGDGGSHFFANPDSPFAAFIGQNAARSVAHSSNHQATFQLRTTPAECVYSPLLAQSFLRDGIQVALGDASVRNITADIDPVTWNRMMHPYDDLPLDE